MLALRPGAWVSLGKPGGAVAGTGSEGSLDGCTVRNRERNPAGREEERGGEGYRLLS